MLGHYLMKRPSLKLYLHYLFHNLPVIVKKIPFLDNAVIKIFPLEIRGAGVWHNRRVGGNSGVEGGR